MERISSSLAQKASIISNINQGNHLSIHIAFKKYEGEQYSDAAQLLETIHQNNPDDIVVKILLSMTYAHLDKYQLAVQFLKSASDSIHSPKTFEFYLKEIEFLRRGESNNYAIERTNIFPNKILGSDQENNFQPIGNSGEYDKLIVSETLAKIFIAQGELKEAISVYEKLIDEKPENKAKYVHSIEELKSRLEN